MPVFMGKVISPSIERWGLSAMNIQRGSSSATHYHLISYLWCICWRWTDDYFRNCSMSLHLFFTSEEREIDVVSLMRIGKKTEPTESFFPSSSSHPAIFTRFIWWYELWASVLQQRGLFVMGIHEMLMRLRSVQKRSLGSLRRCVCVNAVFLDHKSWFE